MSINDGKLRKIFRKRAVQIPLATIIVLIIFSLCVMVVNYQFPSFFTITPGQTEIKKQPSQPPDFPLPEAEAGNSPEAVPAKPYPAAAPEPNAPRGIMMTDTLIIIGDDLFSNWLPNDKAWPTIFMDNPQNFQLGQLEVMRYTTRMMRDKLARLGSTSEIDPDCDRAFTNLSNDAFKWALPSAESRYKKAMSDVKSYRARLVDGQTKFDARADNLSELLDQYVSLLGDINTKLADAPRRQRSKRGGGSAQESNVKVPWSQIDDNFYYAQGAAYVLRQTMVAIKYDFYEIVASKNVLSQIDRIIDVLDQTQFEPWIVLNGNAGGLMANHSMELHSLLENARQKMRNVNDVIKPYK